MTVFFTSDTHFGHAALIEHGYRNFLSVDDMDKAIIARWNQTVSPQDTVYHLGDFTLKSADVAEAYASRLNGKIHLIWGNHDRNAVRKLPRWESSQYALDLKLDGHSLTLCHYAMRVWNKSHYGSIMLHGHSHNGLIANNQSLDIGVDCWNFYPVTLDQIKERLVTLPPYTVEDHHQPKTG